MIKITRTTIISLMLMLFMPMAKLSAQVSVWDGTWEPWTHGTGTEADPFLIENAQQLAYLAYRVNNGLDANGGHVSNHDYHYCLMADINLNGSENFQWTPIGYWNSNSDYQCFGGSFDGNNHMISGLYIQSSIKHAGFFGFTDGAIINNLSIDGICSTFFEFSIYNEGYPSISSGGVSGYSKSTFINNCHNHSLVQSSLAHEGNSTKSFSGGIVGFCEDNTYIANCSNWTDISSNATYESGVVHSYSGGISGFGGNINSCCNHGNVNSHTRSGGGGNTCSYSGGIIGAEGVISNSYNTGTISSSSESVYDHASQSYTGGISGINSSITNCYNAGNTLANGDNNSIGGVSGCSGSILNSYYLNTCGGDNINGGTPMTTVEMKADSFVTTLNDGSCKTFVKDVSPFVNEGYPLLTMMADCANTGPAMNLTVVSATLRGFVSANHISFSKGFEYRKVGESSYTNIIVDGGNNEFTHVLNGLEPNTQYRYRTFCTINDCGTTYYGEEKTFITLPVSVTTNYATNVTANSAILHGYIDIGDATLISKGFEYREEGETEYTTVIITNSNNSFSKQITGLHVNTTYEYRAFMNIAESPTTYYGATKTFEVTWLNQDTIYISDANMLRWVSEQCNSGITFEGKCIKLMNDITLPLNVPNNMTSIGAYPNFPFKGTFDGNGKLIYNLYIDQPNTPYQGFFGYTLNANLYNVGLVNITASGRNYTGGMVAYAKNTYMRDCYVNGGTLFALSYCGGLVGYQEQGTNSIISGCYNTCEVTGNNYVGGLIGFSNYSTVRNSYVAGRVSAQGEPVGAIIGGANEVLMYYCYFSTEITGQTNAIGWNNIGKDGGEGLTNAQMRDPQFVNTLNQNLATPVWMADYTNHINNGFPIIKWQRPGTGMEEHEAAKSCISLFPNPANDFVIIQSDDSSVSLKHMEVYDVMGRKVMSKDLDGQSKEFSIDKLHAGVYHVRVQTDNGHYTNIKLVVQ